VHKTGLLDFLTKSGRPHILQLFGAAWIVLLIDSTVDQWPDARLMVATDQCSIFS